MVNNTLKHAEAKNIRLIMDIESEQIRIRYSDDGKGFDLEEKLQSKTLGLTSIRSRIKFLGGEVSMDSAPGKGVDYRFKVLI
jgi:signal transduction histidine kinase